MNIKRATTIDEQIKKLKERGITILNEEKAKENLLDIGYFRLGFYFFPFEKTFPAKRSRTHEYAKGTLFDNAVKLYYFDVDLRNLFSRYIYRIEINFRTYIIYTVSNAFLNSPTWFADKNIMSNSYVNSFDEKLYKTTIFQKNPIILNHHKKHINDRYAPAWKTLEYMTLGNILYLFRNLKNEQIKREIALHYGFRSVKTFYSYMETLRVIRNYCAHNSVLFDLNLPLSIVNGPAGKLESDKHKLIGAIKVLEYLLKQVSSKRAADLIKSLGNIIKELPDELKSIIEQTAGINLEKIL